METPLLIAVNIKQYISVKNSSFSSGRNKKLKRLEMVRYFTKDWFKSSNG